MMLKEKCQSNEPMSFSSNGTFSLCSKVKGEVMGSRPTKWMRNLPIKKKKKKRVSLMHLIMSLLLNCNSLGAP